MPVRPRPIRSKTGCQSCRRRKVRCDEQKPICRACERLQLPCSFQPGTGPVVATPRFRVRFINSYSPPLLGAKTSKDAQAGTCKPGPGPGPEPTGLTEPTEPTESTEPTEPTEPTELYVSPETDTVSIEKSLDLQLTEEPQLSPEEALAIPVSVTQVPVQVPTFFDLNMHFDQLDETWLALDPCIVSMGDNDPVPVMAVASPPPSPAPIVVSASDAELVENYFTVMSQFTKMRGSSDDNIYTHIFRNMALFYKPLYTAIMAWTGLQLGQTHPQPQSQSRIRQAERRYERAVTLLHADQDVARHFEQSLVTIWFFLQYELLAARGVDAFFRHLEFTADLVDAHRRHHRAGGAAVKLSPVGARVLVWLGTNDARATWIGGSGRLLQNLEMFAYEHDFLAAAFCDGGGDGEGSENSTDRGDLPEKDPYAATSSLETCLRLSLQFDTVENRIAQLHHQPTPAPAAIWLALQSDLMAAQIRLESRPTVVPVLAAMLGEPGSPSPSRRLPTAISTYQFNDLLLLSACYASIICFHRVLPAAVVRDMPLAHRQRLLPADTAATRIIRIEAWVCRLRPPSPQNVWVRILFTAGMETSDPVYQDWAVRTLTTAEQWGGNIAKTRVLLQHMIARQVREGVRMDLLAAMRETTGLFII